MKQTSLRLAVSVLAPVLVAADAAKPSVDAPKSPKATDAIAVRDGAVRRASIAYWQACLVADRRLANELATAERTAHGRDDAAEERALHEAGDDVRQRIGAETVAVVCGSPAGPTQPLRCDAKPH